MRNSARVFTGVSPEKSTAGRFATVRQSGCASSSAVPSTTPAMIFPLVPLIRLLVGSCILLLYEDRRMQEIAAGVAVIPTLIANAYLVGDSSHWVLVDSCTPGNGRRIRRAAARHFGAASRPRAI